jgi:hypothetical protein
VIAPDPVSTPVKPSEIPNDYCSTGPSDAVERTEPLVSHRPSADPSSTSRYVYREPASEFIWRTSCSNALSRDSSATKRVSFVFSSRSWTAPEPQRAPCCRTTSSNGNSVTPKYRAAGRTQTPGSQGPPPSKSQLYARPENAAASRQNLPPDTADLIAKLTS